MEAIGAESSKMDDVARHVRDAPRLRSRTAKQHRHGLPLWTASKTGGNYDGILGVMFAMEVLETVAEKKIPHKHPLTAMIWTNEEGSLYPPAMMCSGIVCYDYLPGGYPRASSGLRT